MSNIIEEVRKFVEEECKKPESKYGYEPYINHFIPTAGYVKILAEKLNADKEIVEIAAWLHDIGSIIYGRENHHITGMQIAEKKLKELGYPKNKIERVKKCIFTHRGSQGIKPETKEAQILNDADAMNAFDHIEGQFYAAFVSEKLNQEKARKSVKKKIEDCYNKLSEEAREIIKNKYEAAMLLLK
ncbi:MAG: HD domain-containing protein [Nanoarchaeota archaeon]